MLNQQPAFHTFTSANGQMKYVMATAFVSMSLARSHAFVTPGFMVPSVMAATSKRAQASSRFTTMAAAPGSGAAPGTVDRPSTRSDVLGIVGATLLGVVAITGGAASPASAASTAEANKKLSSFDLPPVVDAPGGFNTLVEGYGMDGGLKNTLGSSNRDPFLVTWNYPKGWVVTRPNTDTNKEAGTVSTGDYGRGDSAALFVANKALVGGSSLSDKNTVEGVIKKALAQKGDNQFQSFKLKGVKEGATDYAGNKYYIADFQYELLTGAGFIVERKGVASVAQVGNNVAAVVGATTASRAKTVKSQLQEIANSFRAYEGKFS